MIHPENKDERHTYQHQVLHVYEGFQPNRFIQSHYLTPRLVANLFNPSSAQAATESELGLANSFVFNAETNDKAMMIATGLIKNAAVHLDAQEIPFRLVTIPAFSEGFYAQPDGTPWQTQFGDADLLLPEREIRAAAAEAGIPFLALGSYFEASGFSPSEIQALYFYDGRGHLTPKGHEVVGTAVYDCFFAQTLSPDAGCDTR